jgi:HAD superfamily hydrolase (TIGR01450 family)
MDLGFRILASEGLVSTTRAGILAAGVGSRLGGLTADKPKCLVRVSGKPILQHQLQAFADAGVTDVTIVGGYRSSDIGDWLKANPQFQARLLTNDEYEFTNNMYSALMLRPYLEGHPFILCNGDVVFGAEIVDRVASEAGDAIAVDVGSFDEESMKVTTDGEGRIDRISKEIPSDEAHGRSLDLYRFGPASGTHLFDECERMITSGLKNQWTEVAIQNCFDRGLIRPRVVDSRDEPWVEIDTEADLLRADRSFSRFSIADYDQFFIDLDGTLTLDRRLLPGARAFISMLRAAGSSLYVVSNNSSLGSSDYLDRLRQLGIDLDLSEMVLSTDGVAAYLHKRGVTDVYVLGTEAMREHLEKLGVRSSLNDPAFVVVGYDTEMTYDKLTQACMLINAGVPYVASHPDITCPTGGGPIPDIGSITALLELTTGVAPHRVFGKPNVAMLDHLIADPSRAVMIGDRLYTDKALADACGIDFVCTLTGETTRHDIEALPEEDWPALLIPSLEALLV